MTQPFAPRPTWAEISLPALADNYRAIKDHLGGGAQLMAVVKADAYGHGAAECARALEAAGADWFGVALVEEGVALREAGITRPICCLSGFYPGQADAVIAHRLTPAIYQREAAEELDARARAAGQAVSVHLKVDTGMGRLGVAVSEVAELARLLQRLAFLRLDGLLTHFAEADAPDAAYTDRQIAQYHEAWRALRELGCAPAYQHLANSAGIDAHPKARGNLARAGAAMYGLTRDVLAPAPEAGGSERRSFALDVRPVMALYSRVSFLKTVPAGTALGYGRTFITARASRVATLPIGYADGLRRALSNQGRVIVRGCFAPIVGRVSMDLTLVDVTDARDVALGDEVVVIGERGGLRIAAEDLAAQCGTISYEIVCGISARVPRVYVR
jgi:alanine racemase